MVIEFVFRRQLHLLRLQHEYIYLQRLREIFAASAIVIIIITTATCINDFTASDDGINDFPATACCFCCINFRSSQFPHVVFIVGCGEYHAHVCLLRAETGIT